MSTAMEQQSRRSRYTIYIVVGVVVAAAMIIGLILFRSVRSTASAEEMADQLITELEDAGATAPNRDQIVRVLGDDGGATCVDPSAALTRGAFLALLTNGAAGPGIRPVIADSRVVQGQLLIIEIYCPEELEDFQQFVDSLRFEDVARQ